MGNNAKEAKGSAEGSDSSGGLFFVVCALLVFGATYRALYPWVVKVDRFTSQHHTQVHLSVWAFLISGAALGIALLWNRHLDKSEERFVTEKDTESVLLGEDVDTGKEVYLKPVFRTMHTQLIGTTNAGKTASVILPWAVDDIERGRGCLIVDGKSDRGFLDKLYAHVIKAGRQRDFMVFSLASPHLSATFNPFCQGTPEQITERVFSAFNFTDEYYRSVQFSALRTVVALLMRRGQRPMPGVIRECLRDKKKLEGWLDGLNDPNISQDVQAILKVDDEELERKYSGLVTALGHFSQGETMPLYNTRHPEIVLSQVLRQQKICYFQLPTMQFPFLGEATGKLLLQSLQSTISELQVEGDRLKELFSVYLDDFNDYIYPGFTSLLNKSRSANVGVVFAHQSLGDLEKVGPDFKQIVLTNTNIKVIMRSNDPESAEHFSKTIGTVSSEKTTERRTKALLGHEDTGEQSVRNVEEYIFHPNVFKSELGLGEGVVLIPHAQGRVVKRVQFRMVDELPVLRMPIRDLPEVDLATEATNPSRRTGQIKAPPRGKKKEAAPEEESSDAA
jgi:type IV secretory pathway TraG/TraD family ATPase VirD4